MSAAERVVPWTWALPLAGGASRARTASEVGIEMAPTASCPHNEPHKGKVRGRSSLQSGQSVRVPVRLRAPAATAPLGSGVMCVSVGGVVLCVVKIRVCQEVLVCGARYLYCSGDPGSFILPL